LEAHSIQVGAFKDISNVYIAADKLSSYDVYVEPYKDMHRVHVVNIADKKILKKIRKFYPKAFFSKLNISHDSHDIEENIQTEQFVAEPTTNYIQPVEIFKEKVKVVEPQDWLLNSDSILKTRKSFL
jgi:hypothetical protein